MIRDYIALLRLDKPIGLFLLLWPTLWALWLAGNHHPPVSIVMLFIAGVVIMRSAGCIVNDFADRHFDLHVARTRERPLAKGRITVRQAAILFFVLLIFALGLVLQLNALTFLLSCFALLFAVIYPFLKRITYLPQLGLGIAFAWSVPMAFAAITHQLPPECWLLFAASLIWPVMYDTLYAMIDREDDKKIGIKSTAVLFEKYDCVMIAFLQLCFIGLLVGVGIVFHLGLWYFLGVFFASCLLFFQQKLIRTQSRENYYRAFLNNHWVGAVIFLGIIL